MMQKFFLRFRDFFAWSAVLLLCVGSMAAATTSFDCSEVWSGPSKDNDVISCVFSMRNVKNRWPSLVFPAVAALTFLIIFFLMPPLFCCCGCCCGEDKGSKFSKQVLVFGVSICGATLAAIFLFAGGFAFDKNYNGALDSFFNNASQVPLKAKDEIVECLSNYSVNPPTPPSLNLTNFEDLEAKVVSDVRNVTNKFPSIVVTLVPCILGAVLLLLTVLFLITTALCLKRVACIAVWFYYLMALIMCLLSIVFGFFLFVTDGLCGEIVLQYLREPGIFQWYAEPMIADMASFSATVTELQAQVNKSVTNGCSVLLSKCTPPTEQATSKPFVCGLSTCSSLSDLYTSTQEGYVLVSNAPMLCSPSLVNNYKCTIPFCATNCIDEFRPQALDVLEALDAALNASIALSFASPFVNPNYLLDIVVGVLQSPATSPTATNPHEGIQHCNELVRSSTILQVGCFIAALCLFFEVLVLVRIYRIFANQRNNLVHEPFFDDISEENLTEQEPRKNR